MLTGRAALSYELTPGSTVYASVSRGAKSGGFPNFTNNAPTGLGDRPYQESTSWTYEIGTKNHFLGGRALLNASLFFNDVKDQHLFALDSASFTFRPQPLDTQSYGAELELGYRLMPGLDLLGSVGYTKAEVRNVSADVAASSGAQDGNRVPSTPRFTSSLTLQYRESAAFLGLGDDTSVFGLAQHQYVGARAADVGNNFDLDAYHMVNLKLGLEFETFDIYLFGQNLTDARPQYIGLYYGPGAEAVTFGHGRVVGIGAQARF
jgi:iron complex outermembrane receptor protein